MEIKTMSYYKHPRDFPFWIKRNRHDKHDIPPLHGHEFVELIYVESGQATHLFQDISYEVRAGDIFIINPGEVHGYAIQDGQQIIVTNCLFDPGFIPTSLLRELRLSDALDFFYVQPFLNKEARFHHKLNLRGSIEDVVRSGLKELHQELLQARPGYQAVVQLRMTELFILLSRYYTEEQRTKGGSASSELLVQRMCGYVERHYDQRITLSTLSELYHIGVRQLNRLFHRHKGSTVIEYLHRVRMEKAKRLLVDTDEKMNVVSEMVGYEDVAFFSKLFTRVTGTTPGKYRDMHR
ncbi:helix-turn-helix domain-containing protein [Paenibacillus mesophilus]|uniref:AraC family transcriptional regulator n=1 Tax=Paenibacillus mesophilus TaxID=2582849 RepID=UPI00110D670B|nr:AraC family transcriptional regulator [Paenibacillus mesophilus]TMV48686.1 helix-turn-helix domain-containing protein [Paenibacillus mesophilus]